MMRSGCQTPPTGAFTGALQHARVVLAQIYRLTRDWEGSPREREALRQAALRTALALSAQARELDGEDGEWVVRCLAETEQLSRDSERWLTDRGIAGERLQALLQEIRLSRDELRALGAG